MVVRWSRDGGGVGVVAAAPRRCLVGFLSSCATARYVTSAACFTAAVGRPPTDAVVRGGSRAAAPHGLGGPRVPFSPPPLATLAPPHGGGGFGRAVSRFAGLFFRLPPCYVNGGWARLRPRPSGWRWAPFRTGGGRSPLWSRRHRATLRLSGGRSPLWSRRHRATLRLGGGCPPLWSRRPFCGPPAGRGADRATLPPLRTPRRPPIATPDARRSLRCARLAAVLSLRPPHSPPSVASSLRSAAPPFPPQGRTRCTAVVQNRFTMSISLSSIVRLTTL